MRIVGTVMGALVAAVVLIVVAVPILGGLVETSHTETVYADEYNGESPVYHYILYDPDGYPRLSSIQYLNRDVKLTYAVSDTDTIDHIIRWTALADDKVIITTGKYNELDTAIYAGTQTGTIRNIGQSTNLDISNSQMIVFESNAYYFGTGSSKQLLGEKDIYTLCPESIGTHMMGKKIQVEETVNVFANMIASSSDLETLTLFGSIDISEADTGIELNDTNLNKGTGRGTYTNIQGMMTVEHTGHGATAEIDNLTATYNTNYTKANNGLWLMAPISYEVTISGSDATLSALVWLLPVMLAVVLIASVAYQIVPKRRNTE